jgi:WD40 repeat protein
MSKRQLVHHTHEQFLAKYPTRVGLFQQQFDTATTTTATTTATTPLAIQTEFVPWCCKYFLKPLLAYEKQGQESSTSSSPVHVINGNGKSKSEQTEAKIDWFNSEFLDQKCRLLYNQRRKKQPPKWTEWQQMQETLHIKHTGGGHPRHCKFHPYESQLFVADEECLITVYDTSSAAISNVNHPVAASSAAATVASSSAASQLAKTTQLMQFSNSSGATTDSTLLKKTPTTKITSFHLINVQHEAIVLSATDDRIVRFWKPRLTNFGAGGGEEKKKSCELITAFQAYSDVEKRESNFEAGLIVEWHEANEVLLCSGDTTFIRVWDMHKEMYRDYMTQVASCVFSMSTSDNYTVAGFGDGTIKLFDFRQSKPVGLFQQHHHTSFLSSNIFKHESYVRKVQLHKATSRLVTTGAAGDISIFDMRNRQYVLEASISNESLTALECHPINELIAS